MKLIAVVLYIMFNGTVLQHQTLDDMAECQAAVEQIVSHGEVPKESTICIPLYRSIDR